MVSPQEPSPKRPLRWDPDQISQEIARLRAEHDATESAVIRALLLHEIGVLEELSGDTGSAARDQLDAVNAEPEFREPLERLIQIIQRSGSSKNLGKLLERLAQVADGADERVRALLEQAAYLADVEEDFDAARTVLEEAAEEKPDDASVYLALEVIAGKFGDAPLRRRALAARAEHTEQPTWRALLLLDIAKIDLESGDSEAALESIEKAVAQKSEATFLALLALEEYGRNDENEEIVARALEAQAGLIVRSLGDEGGDELGVPRHRRTSAHAADSWLRAAEAHRRRGDVQAAAELLDQAMARVPNEPALIHARLVAAEVLGDTQKCAELARAEIERGAKGGLATALWLRIAESAASDGDGAGALDAVRRGLLEDPGSIAARVLELDLLDPGQDGPGLAASLEATADQISSDDGKARFYLTAADAWARIAVDTAGAKGALSQAGMYGASASTMGRVARMLAAISSDGLWYDEATRRLISSGTSEHEQVALWFELARNRLLRGEHETAKTALSTLSESEKGRWLGSVLRAYALPLAQGSLSPDGDAALVGLAMSSDDPNVARALRTAVAFRALAAGRREDAVRELDELCSSDSGDVVVASARAALARVDGDPRRAAEVLAACAGASDDTELAAGLELEAGILFWQGGDRKAGVEAFSRAANHSHAAAGSVLAWALRAADPDSLEARRRALEAPTDSSEEGAVAIERFALEAGAGGDPAVAREMLDALGSTSHTDFGNAALLARALWSPNDEPARLDALEEVSKFGGSAEAAAAASRYLSELRAAAAGGRLADGALALSAERWAESDRSAASAAEWLGAAVASKNPHDEAAARRALAERIGGPGRAALEAGASLVAWLGGSDSEPLLEGNDRMSELANLELAAPGSDPRRRRKALGAVESALGEDSAPLARALRAWNELAAGDVEAAIAGFRAVVESYPDEVIGWEGLRAAAEISGDRPAVAEASAALGDAVHDDARGAELWEQSAFILIDELHDVGRGEFALTRAIARDIGRFKAFDRLFRVVRERRDGPRLLVLIAKRLEVAEDPVEIAKLYWERARVLRESGDRDGALTALENVTLLEPDHVGALALSGEIYLTTGKLPEAAERLARLSMLSDAPVKQRLMSGVAAVDIYENKLNQVEKALDVLEGLYRSGLSTQPVRERFARAAAKANAWEKATDVLEHLMLERDSREGRIEAARLALAIRRDRLRNPTGAVKAVEKLLEEEPGDNEALDVVLSGVLPRDVERRLLDRGRSELVQGLQAEPLHAERVDQLARIAAKLDLLPLRQAALGALVALGEGTPEIDRELSILDQRVARMPAIAVDPRALPDLCDPEDAGPLPDLMAALASTFADALGPGLQALGVGKRDRVDPRTGLPVRNEIAAWAGAFGLGDFELFVGGHDDHGITAVATEMPAIVIGRAVQAPLAAAHRQAIARELFALRRGTTILRHRDAGDVAALVVAACRLVGYEIPSPQYAMLGEFQRLLGKQMPRRVKKILGDLAGRFAQSGQDVFTWTRAATSSLDRLAVIAAGDVSWVLAGGSRVRGQLGASHEAQERTARLLAFVLSPTYLAIREHLGMGVR